MDEASAGTGAAFESTQWTVLEGLRSEDEAVRRAAAERAAATYWPPVYAAARRLMRTRDEAAELTQAFFADVVLGRKLLEQADPGQGHLRSFLRAALRRYATDAWRRERARGGGRLAPLRDLDREDALACGSEPETAFDRRWALALFEEALRRCGRHFEGNGRAGHWRLFESRVMGPALGRCELRPLAEESEAMGFGSAAEAAAAVQTVKRRFDAIFREVVGETLSDGARLEDECREVRRLIEG